MQVSHEAHTTAQHNHLHSHSHTGPYSLFPCTSPDLSDFACCRYMLRAADLSALPHAVDANPVNPAFQAMQLFRRPDVARAAMRRWGGVAGMLKKVGPVSCRVAFVASR